MSKRPNPALVGAFILGAVALAIVAITVWGSGRLFERRYKYLCYFPGSVHGLQIGAPVKYRGVAIGEVVDKVFGPQLGMEVGTTLAEERVDLVFVM